MTEVKSKRVLIEFDLIEDGEASEVLLSMTRIDNDVWDWSEQHNGFTDDFGLWNDEQAQQVVDGLIMIGDPAPDVRSEKPTDSERNR